MKTQFVSSIELDYHYVHKSLYRGRPILYHDFVVGKFVGSSFRVRKVFYNLLDAIDFVARFPEYSYLKRSLFITPLIDSNTY